MWRERGIVREAKLATFAEVLAVISFGAAAKDPATRFERMAIAFKTMLGGIDAAEIRWRLMRAAVIGILASRKPALADIVNGPGRLLILRNVRGREKADEVWDFVDAMLANSLPLDEQVDVTDAFSGPDMKLAQLQLEADLVRLYEAALRDSKG